MGNKIFNHIAQTLEVSVRHRFSMSGAILEHKGILPRTPHFHQAKCKNAIRKLKVVSILSLIGFLCCCSEAKSEVRTTPLNIASPDGQLVVEFQLDERGSPTFTAHYREVPIAAGDLGLEFTESGQLAKDLRIIDTHYDSRDATYKIPVGKSSYARDCHRELIVSLQETSAPQRKLDIAFRVFNDGIAFRYLIPKQEAIFEFAILNELSRLSFPGNPVARFLPVDGYSSAYENYYETLPLSDIDTDLLLAMPLLLEVSKEESPSIWVAICEANLTDFAGMYLSAVQDMPDTLQAKLSPLPDRQDHAKVLGQAPHNSPWRILMVADNPGRLVESNIIFNLNEPSKLEDPSWIKPGATTFPWWNGYADLEGDFETGVNTATMKHYIDFCAESGIPYHSLDGLDIAWYDGPIFPQGATDVTTAAPSINMPELLQYASEKGVRLRLWLHWSALKPQLDDAFALYEKWGIEGVMIDFMNRDDQEMVNWYHEVAEKAARHHLTVTWHGAYKPTGMERTWPNVLTYEAVLNQEYNKWSGKGTPPEHNLDVAFIRNIAGPLDYHQNGMRSQLPENFHPSRKSPPVQGTRGHQLAQNIVYLNHLPMIADYPSAYHEQDGFDFLTTIPCNWDETRVPHAEIDSAIVVARRKGEKWYLGGMTGQEACDLKLPLHFLGEGQFEIVLYVDNPDQGPTSLSVDRLAISENDILPVKMPAAGGFVAVIQPIRQ